MIADATTQQIHGSFDAISLILVFVSVVFGIKYPAIWGDLRSTAPPAAQPMARTTYRRRLLRRLLADALPLVVLTACAWLLFLPLFVHVAAAEPFHAWNRDVTDNAFLLIAGLTGIFFIWSLGLSLGLVAKMLGSR